VVRVRGQGGESRLGGADPGGPRLRGGAQGEYVAAAIVSRRPERGPKGGLTLEKMLGLKGAEEK